jgi:DNA-binding transcriptional regulator YhcF (GntR family)
MTTFALSVNLATNRLKEMPFEIVVVKRLAEELGVQPLAVLKAFADLRETPGIRVEDIAFDEVLVINHGVVVHG